jgi:Spy/CpxP family protein refolding chaperone
MKRLLAFAVAGVVALGAASVFAGGACCAAGKDKKISAKADGKAGCGDVFAKLNLTDEQKTKLAALKAECDKEGCSEASHTKFMKGMKEILTAEQLALCESECKKETKSGCPYMKGEKKS